MNEQCAKAKPIQLKSKFEKKKTLNIPHQNLREIQISIINPTNSNSFP